MTNINKMKPVTNGRGFNGKGSIDYDVSPVRVSHEDMTSPFYGTYPPGSPILVVPVSCIPVDQSDCIGT